MGEWHRPWVGATMHVAVPITPTEDYISRCGVCLDRIKHLPAGQGWVHEDGHKTALNFHNFADTPEHTDKIQYGVRYGDGEVDEYDDAETAERQVASIRQGIAEKSYAAADYEPMTVVTRMVRTYAPRETGWAIAGPMVGDAAACPRCEHPNLDHYWGYCHHPTGPVTICGCRVNPSAASEESMP